MICGVLPSLNKKELDLRFPKTEIPANGFVCGMEWNDVRNTSNLNLGGRQDSFDTRRLWMDMHCDGRYLMFSYILGWFILRVHVLSLWMKRQVWMLDKCMRYSLTGERIGDWDGEFSKENV